MKRLALLLAVVLAAALVGGEAQAAAADHVSDQDFALVATAGGITWDGTYYRVTGGRIVHAYDRGGDRVSDEDFDRATTANAGGIAWNDTNFLVANLIGLHFPRFDSDGSRVGSGIRRAAANAHPSGITWDDTYHRVVDRSDDKVYTYDSTDAYVSDEDFDLASGNDTPEGITWDGTYYRVVDRANNKVYTYDRDGDHVSDEDFDLASGNDRAGGIAWDGTYYRVANSTGGSGSNKVYTYEGNQVKNLRQTAVTVRSVALEWDAVTGATSYGVEWRAGSSGAFTEATAAVTTHTVQDLDSGTSYEFRVRGKTSLVSYPYSAILTVATPSRPCEAGDVTDLGALAPGSTTMQTVTALVCQGGVRNGRLVNAAFYSFTVTENVATGVIALDRVFTGADPYLILWQNPFGGAPVNLAADDDSGSGTNSAISYDFLTGTTYYIEATTYRRNATGDMTLSIILPAHREVSVRLLGSDGFTAYVDYTSSTGTYSGGLPGSGTFTSASYLDISVRDSLIISLPLSVQVVGHDGSTTATLVMAQRENRVIDGLEYKKFRSGVQLGHAVYAGGTFTFNIGPQITTSLGLMPSPEAQRWRGTLHTAQSFNVENADGALTVTVSAGLRVSTDSSWTPDCSVEAQSMSATGGAVLIAPCESGQQTITLVDSDASRLDTAYMVTVLAAPTLSPVLPSGLAADGQWHRYTHSDPHQLVVRASHVDASARLVVSLSNTDIHHCDLPVTSPSQVTVGASAFYLAGCVVGDVLVSLLDGSDVVATFSLAVVASTASAYLNPSPADSTIEVDSEWHTFTNVHSGALVVSTDSNGARLAVAATDAPPVCPATAEASVAVGAGGIVYLAGCSSGAVTLILSSIDGAELARLELTVSAGAFVAPDPASVPIRAETRWHEFSHTGTGTLTVQVNRGQAVRRLAVALNTVGSANCVQAVTNQVSVPAGTRFYITGCLQGGGHISLLDESGNLLINYEVTVLPALVVIASDSDPHFDFRKRGTIHLPGTGQRLQMLNVLAGSYADRDGYSYEARFRPKTVPGKVPILVDVTRDKEPDCTIGDSSDGRTIDVTLQAGDTLWVRACTVDYSQSDIGDLNLSDGILGEVDLSVYRVHAGGTAAVLVHEEPLTVYANDLVLTKPVREWRVNHAEHGQNTNQGFRVPVEWRHPVGDPYGLVERARFLGWVANSPGHTGLVFSGADAASTAASGCKELSTEAVANVDIRRFTRDGTLPYTIQTCNSNSTGVTDVALFYMRGSGLESNLIWRYVFETTSTAPVRTKGDQQTAIGTPVPPTPIPTPTPAGRRGRQYTGQRPQVSDHEVGTAVGDDRVLNVRIFWDPLPDTDGYNIRIDGLEQPSNEDVFATTYYSEGYQLEANENLRTVRFAVRGFKGGSINGSTTADGIFVPPHETYHSPWSQDYEVFLREGGVGLTLTLGEQNPDYSESVDLTAREIPKAGLISDAQQNVRVAFADLTGLKPESSEANALLPLIALCVGVGLLVVSVVVLGPSPWSVCLGLCFFTASFSIGGPLFMGVPVAMAAIFSILAFGGGGFLVKTRMGM